MTWRKCGGGTWLGPTTDMLTSDTEYTNGADGDDEKFVVFASTPQLRYSGFFPYEIDDMDAFIASIRNRWDVEVRQNDQG